MNKAMETRELHWLEIWKIIESNPDYEISNKGRVKNIRTNFILSPTIHYRKDRYNPTIYLRVELKNPKKKYLVHRLVANAFIPNIMNYDQINHKNEDGTVNEVWNLEWCNTKYNCEYSRAKKVIQIDLLGNIINTFNSLTNAAKFTNSDFRLISAVCLGKRKTHNKFIWEYQ